MNINERRNFLKKISIIAVASAIMPRSLFANNSVLNPKGNIKDVMNFKLHALDVNFRVVDLHSHPSLKIYLLKKRFWTKHYPSKGDNMLQVEVDARGMESNCVMGLITTHYLVEKDIVRKASLLNQIFLFLKKSPIASRLENEDLTNFTQVCQMMDDLEHQVSIANERYYYAEKIVIARNFNEFQTAIERGQIPFAHALEGAHSLGRIKPISTDKRAAYEISEDYALNDKTDIETLNPELTKNIKKDYKDKLEQSNFHLAAGRKEARNTILNLPPRPKTPEKIILENLAALKKRGVCLITLAHFFRNDLITYPAEGMAPNEEKRIGMCPQYNSSNDKNDVDTNGLPLHRLTDFGGEVVRKMFELGIIVDLTHTNPRARKDVFEINKNYNRPVIFSHSGAKHVFDKLGRYSDYGYYNVTDATNSLFENYDEIEEVRKCDGLIGIIPEVFWLTGGNIHLKGCKRRDFLYGIDYMIETMQYICKRTGTYDNIAVGTDFDGLADQPKDLYIYNHISRLTDEMSKQGIPDTDIKKIMNGNAMRVLKKGWT